MCLCTSVVPSSIRRGEPFGRWHLEVFRARRNQSAQRGCTTCVSSGPRHESCREDSRLSLLKHNTCEFEQRHNKSGTEKSELWLSLCFWTFKILFLDLGIGRGIEEPGIEIAAATQKLADHKGRREWGLYVGSCHRFWSFSVRLLLCSLSQPWKVYVPWMAELIKADWTPIFLKADQGVSG